MATEQTSSRNLHRPKEASIAKEEGSDEARQTGRLTELATSLLKKMPGSKESPGRADRDMKTSGGRDLTRGGREVYSPEQ
jgi:hypothetical protein